MLVAAIRAATFKAQIAGEIAQRRQELERCSTQAAEAGNTEALLQTERDLALLPALESRLRAQADAAGARADGLNDKAARVESRASELRASAAALRRRADIDPLSSGEPPARTEEPPPSPNLVLDLGKRRKDALRTIQQTADLHTQDPEALTTTFEQDGRKRLVVLLEEAKMTALAQLEREKANTLAQLEEVARLVGQVRDATVSESDRRLHAPLGMVFTAPIAGLERQELAASVASYRARLGRELPRCHDLATNSAFGIVDNRFHPDRFAAAVNDAADSATEELARERAALDL